MNELFSIAGKVAVITGAGGVLGGNIAQHFVQQGAKVVAIDIRQEQLDNRVAELKQYGQDVIGIIGDVLDIASLEKVAEEIVAQWGQIDILLNIAGGNMPGATLESDQNFYDICDMHSRNIKSNSIFINKICNCLSHSSHLPAWFLMIFSVFLSFSASTCMKFIFQTLCQKHLIYIFHVMLFRCRSSLRRMLSCLTCPDLCRTSVVCITI